MVVVRTRHCSGCGERWQSGEISLSLLGAAERARVAFAQLEATARQGYLAVKDLAELAGAGEAKGAVDDEAMESARRRRRGHVV